MGWWDEAIYGGDTPLNWKEKIYTICETEEYGSDHDAQPIKAETLSEKLEEIIKTIEACDTGADDINIGYQVLGAIILHAGYDIELSEGLRDRIMRACIEDAYAIENYVRRNVVKNFRRIVRDYEFSNPVNVDKLNLFEEGEEDEEEITKEFKQIFGLINARMKKLENGIEEKSGNKEYDEGWQAASEEELEFLVDFKELMSKMEMMGVLFEKIAQGLIGNPVSSSSGSGDSQAPSGNATPAYENKSMESSGNSVGGSISLEPPVKSSSAGKGKDIMPG